MRSVQRAPVPGIDVGYLLLDRLSGASENKQKKGEKSDKSLFHIGPSFLDVATLYPIRAEKHVRPMVIACPILLNFLVLSMSELD